MHQKPSALLRQRRFGPFFLTQFLGAFNDNVFKNALVILVTFQVGKGADMDSDLLVNLCAALFILPFFLFSATAGQVADKYEKSGLIRKIKLLEVAIMGLAAIGFWLDSVYFLMGVLFLMGTQSTFFGPIKYGILPQHLHESELIGGNALVEMGTFLAILLGIIAGSKLIGIEGLGALAVSATVIGVALVGVVFSRMIPSAAAADAQLKMNLNPLTETWRTIGYTREVDSVFKSVLGISWFWFFGATLLTQLPNFSKTVLYAGEDVYIVLLAMFSVGVGLGSILCEKLSGDVVEIGLVPIGSFMLTVFCADLYFSSDFPVRETLMDWPTFWAASGSLRVLLDIVLIGVFGGFFIVPLYALVQQRSVPSHRSRVIAGNNILNALFMVLSAVMAVVVLKLGFSIPELFLITAALNVLVAAYIFTLVPEFMMRCLIWCIVNTMYRVRKEHLDRIPREGGALIVCNHVSMIDALVIAACTRRPVRFVMYYKIFQVPVLSFIFRTGKAIPIAGRKEDPEMMDAAFDRISEALGQGDLICIFPEGKLTGDGDMDVFRPGVERILKANPVTVVPMALRGLWGSFFSREGGSAMRRPFRRIWSRITLSVGEPITAEQASAEYLHTTVLALRGDRQK
ncbi:phospholipid/glycerol acyltransferase:Major facilitator superfamily MFS_1 [gamma proteobacterium HTCC5015]|nr:phospholipid/glycerol acyltransferase:Major facilitator superfamily MFS_1 [gamma proteobacterium HTCC5015]